MIAVFFQAVVITVFVFTGTVSSAVAGHQFYKGEPAKYVFYFIGDGMGIPQRTAAGKYREARLLIDSFPAQGVTTTHAANQFITDSAASGTSLATGAKTNVGMLGMLPDGKVVKSVAELAKEKGMKVGIVSSVSIDHATPASFYAHVNSRSHYYDIDVALAESGFDFFGGGGLKDPGDNKKKSKSYRGDALKIAEENGYKLVSSKDLFLNLSSADGRILARNQWLQDSGALPYAMDSRPGDITLAEFTAKAVELLDNPKGFFMMVEGGKIDWACHANDGTAAIHDTVAFDEAVKVAVDFADKHPHETLVVVTGDHECGGLALGFAGTRYASHYEILGRQKISFTKFNQEVLGNLKKKGSDATGFESVKEAITKYFGLTFPRAAETAEKAQNEAGVYGSKKSGDPMVLEPHEIVRIRDAFKRSLEGKAETATNLQTYLLYGGYEPLTITLTHILNQKAGLAWTSYSHTGVPVITSAYGLGAEVFNGYYDNTDVALKIMSVLGIEPEAHYVEAGESNREAVNF